MDSLLRDTFGFQDFRPGQREVIERLLEGRSTLAIFPTGAGKSLCYQLPALALPGLALVVSPLIALMKDQLDALQRRGVAAGRLDSSLDAAGARALWSRLRAGELKLLFVAPERFGSERFLQTVRRLPLSLLAVDEAHCISEWGHNFRPDYMKLADLARELRVPRVLALTATATPMVAESIAAAFGIAPEDVVRTGFHRPNLELRMSPGPAAERDERLVERLRSRPPGPTLVYVTLQRTAEEVAARLAREGLPARAYHAGLEAERRAEVQDWFMASDRAIVVATIAFGMGIDKADIRAVYHYNLPKSMENYAQEIGRAGRDDRPSVCEVLAAPQDVVALENFTFGDTPTRESLAGLVDEVLGAGAAFDVSIYDLSGRHDVRNLVVDTILTYLELDGVIRSTGPFYSEYRLRWLRDPEEAIARFDRSRQDFLRRMLDRAVAARVWSRLDVHEAAAALGEPRDRLVRALNYLEEQGDVALQVAGVRLGYRRVAREVDREALLARLAQRFEEREARDRERLEAVRRLSEHPGCTTRELLAWFGEELPGPCGHCGPCLGSPPRPSRERLPDSLTPEQGRLVEEAASLESEALAHPRQRARFLCGLTSPATTRARLTRHRLFGSLAEVPFPVVLAACS